MVEVRSGGREEQRLMVVVEPPDAVRRRPVEMGHRDDLAAAHVRPVDVGRNGQPVTHTRLHGALLEDIQLGRDRSALS
jgi:hypothetical protein